ncbi:MAG TPA: hypothetical protein DDX39_06285 [Bacteroidales bacterium]|nr:MAG: hypothetical protein A2W98_00540 [Bacteroidetes bacterium GWF2_33_38]OFY71739.1 MAG: hypothetical protein A2265_02855 [Bacteroidetes bacterium RIFOXYA12_FULL_33_9]OFY90214.1 MAG: hypothetical protein A2236_02705 [Bacteroidetes bacterium RIFOXYA2_FULL_33_7]HBF88233.1 hypothetical protein [Bacteroidales bacterium]
MNLYNKINFASGIFVILSVIAFITYGYINQSASIIEKEFCGVVESVTKSEKGYDQFRLNNSTEYISTFTLRVPVQVKIERGDSLIKYKNSNLVRFYEKIDKDNYKGFYFRIINGRYPQLQQGSALW